jgi:hypothetical protein
MKAIWRKRRLEEMRSFHCEALVGVFALTIET